MIENYLVSAIQNTVRMTEVDRLEKFRRNWEIYYGEGKKPLAVLAGAADDNLRINFARMFVDKGVSFLFGKEVGFELTEGKQTPAEDYLTLVWQANRKMSTLQKVGTSGGVCGTAFVKLQWNPGMAYPRLILVDPETVTVTLAEEDIEQVSAYFIQYPSIDPATDKPITIRQLIERDGAGWLITDQRGGVDDSQLQTVGVQKWPHLFAPMVHCQNMIAPHEFWGMSDIEDDLVEAIDKENFTVSNILKILRFHAHPHTWASGVGKADVIVNPDEMMLLPTGAVIGNLEMQSDLVSSIQMHKELKQLVHELARVPEVATGKVENIGQLSGVALEIMYQPLIEKTEAKRITYGEMIIEINRRILALGGFGDNNITQLRWQELLPKDKQTEATSALTLKQLGVSGDTLLQQFGFDPDLERTKRAKESDLGKALLEAFDRGGAETE